MWAREEKCHIISIICGSKKISYPEAGSENVVNSGWGRKEWWNFGQRTSNLVKIVGARLSDPLFIIVTTVDKKTCLKLQRAQILNVLTTEMNMH